MCECYLLGELIRTYKFIDLYKEKKNASSLETSKHHQNELVFLFDKQNCAKLENNILYSFTKLN